jgi:hypothetical protein
VPPVEGAVVLGVVVVVGVVVDVELVPVAPNATAPTAPPPNMAARKPAVTNALRIPFMHLLRRMRAGSRLPIGDRWGFP